MNDLIPVQMIIPAIPAPTGNLDDVQANIDNLISGFAGRVYTADEIKSAKSDCAQLNKWDEQLADASKAIKDTYLERVNPTLDRISKMRGQVKQAAAAIDRQVKNVEEAEKEDKRKALEQVYQDAAGADLMPLAPFSRIMDRRWLNKTVPLSTAARELRKLLEQRREELRIIRDTCGDDADACIAEYTKEFSLNSALREHQRRQDVRAASASAEAARKAAEMERDSLPVIQKPTAEDRQIRAEAVANAQAAAYITEEGRLDTDLMEAAFRPQETGDAKRYRFWVDFTEDDVRWFKTAAKERGFRYGSISKNN